MLSEYNKRISPVVETTITTTGEQEVTIDLFASVFLSRSIVATLSTIQSDIA
jgi:hypothetical protein